MSRKSDIFEEINEFLNYKRLELMAFAGKSKHKSIEDTIYDVKLQFLKLHNLVEPEYFKGKITAGIDYHFEVNFIKKELSPQKDAECEEFMSYSANKLSMTRLSEGKFVCIKTDNTDLTKACLFGWELREHPEYFRV